MASSLCADEIVHLGKRKPPAKPMALRMAHPKPKALLLVLFGILLSLIAPTCSLAQNWIPWANTLPLISVQPKLFIGRMYPARPTIFSIHTSGDFGIEKKIGEQTLTLPAHFPWKLDQFMNVRGSWTEVNIPIEGPVPIGFALSMGYLFPANDPSDETYLIPGRMEQRTWRTRMQMFNVQVSVSYRFIPILAGILGFRYDSFMIDYLEPEGQFQDPLIFHQNHSAGLTVTGDIPFAGVMIDGNFLGGINVKAGAIGLPALPGDISYREGVGVLSPFDNASVWGRGVVISREFRRGYFFEGFAEVSAPVYSRFQGGAFVKYNSIFGKATKATVTTGGTSTTTVDANLIFDRSSFMIGGTIGMSF